MKRQIVCMSVLFAVGVGAVARAGQAATADAVSQEHAGHAAQEGPPLTLKAALDEALAKITPIISYIMKLKTLRRGALRPSRMAL